MRYPKPLILREFRIRIEFAGRKERCFFLRIEETWYSTSRGTMEKAVRHTPIQTIDAAVQDTLWIDFGEFLPYQRFIGVCPISSFP